MVLSDDGDVPQGVTVCVRVRPMLTQREDGIKAREATCMRIVEMEGEQQRGCGSAVTRIYNPKDKTEKPKEFAFDRSYWSCDGFVEDPERPGFMIPDGPKSKYVDQDMVWDDIGQLVMRNALQGYNCTVFAYGQSGSGKSYSVVGYEPNKGIIPNTLTFLFSMIEENADPDIRFQVEIAMLEVYMDEVYDLLEPKKAERQKLKVFVNNNQVIVYDPSDRKNMDKIWRAARDMDAAEQFRLFGDANRSVRATGMNPSSSRGHTVFMCRFTKAVKQPGGQWVEEFKSKISLVDLAGSERAHDTGLSGAGLKEGIAINQSLNYLGQVLVQLCKSERVNYRDKLTQLLAESLNGQAVTVMIAAISPADINYDETISTLRFADNAKKMPVNARKQVSPTVQLITDLKEENRRLQEELSKLHDKPDGGGASGLEEAQRAVENFKKKSEELDGRLAQLEPEYEHMAAKMRQLRGEATAADDELLLSLEGLPEDYDDNTLQRMIAQLEPKMEAKLNEIEAVNSERNRIKYEFEDAKQKLGDGLKEKQQAILALLETSEMQGESWEQKLTKADEDSQKLRQALQEKGVSVNEILGLMNKGVGSQDEKGTQLRYFVNLCEDSHENGLLFFIPFGTSQVKRFVPNDAEPGIKLPGDSIEPHHATIENDPETGAITIACANEQAQLWVNGAKVLFDANPVELVHGARVIIGFEFIFRYVDPKQKIEKKVMLNKQGVPTLVDAHYALEELKAKSGQDKASAVENGKRNQVGRHKRRKEIRKSLMRRATFNSQREDELMADFQRRLQEQREKLSEELVRKRQAGTCAGKMKLKAGKDCSVS